VGLGFSLGGELYLIKYYSEHRTSFMMFKIFPSCLPVRQAERGTKGGVPLSCLNVSQLFINLSSNEEKDYLVQSRS